MSSPSDGAVRAAAVIDEKYGAAIRANGGLASNVLQGLDRDAVARSIDEQAGAGVMLEALRGIWRLCPLGHQEDERGLWADVRNAIATGEGRL